MWSDVTITVYVKLPCIMAACVNEMYVSVNKLGNKAADVNTTVLDTISSSNGASCATKCYSKKNCRCLRLQNEVCTLYEYCPEPVGDLHGAMYYTKSGLMGHNGSCTDYQVCGFDGATCYKGQCLCQIGLYFSTSRNRCLRECEEYSDEMTLYRGAAISGHNTVRYSGMSVSDCLVRCVQTTTFTCRSVDAEYGSGLCHLSDVGYLDVPVTKRLVGLVTWNLGQRNCK